MLSFTPPPRTNAVDSHASREDREALPVLSVVVPCFNEEENIRALADRLTAACDASARGNYELILVNDGSRDRTRTIIEELSEANGTIVGIDLARNYGHQIALTAGLSFAKGERILIIDADMQDPPELLADMMAAMDDGANVVYGRRAERLGETRFKRGSARVFYKVLSTLAKFEMPRDSGDFRLMDRRALDALLGMPEQYRFIRGMIAWIGLEQRELVYTRQPRHAGTTKYTLRKMVDFAADAITGFSTAPLRLAFLASFLFFAGALGVGLYGLAFGALADMMRNGLGMLCLFLFFSSVQLACLGIVGEYVGRTHMQVKNRPLFIVKEVITRGCAPPPAHPSQDNFRK